MAGERERQVMAQDASWLIYGVSDNFRLVERGGPWWAHGYMICSTIANQ